MKRELYCDSCKEETPHNLLNPSRNLFQCEFCGSVVEVTPEKRVEIRAIISRDDVSERGKVEVPVSETLTRGEEIVVEVGDGYRIGEITSLELKNGKRVDVARAEDIETVWLRDVGEVKVRISLHKGPVTTPYEIFTSGEVEFTVGEILPVEGRQYRITRIKLINGGLLKKEGKSAKAKEIRRIYAQFIR
ncbi:HVO_0476 family zinc finger protein [Geoglobus sp.]